jgi:hypothetical protein
MKRSRELSALLIAAGVILAMLAAYFLVDPDLPTAPTVRTTDQNTGGDAPSEVQSSPNGQGG